MQMWVARLTREEGKGDAGGIADGGGCFWGEIQRKCWFKRQRIRISVPRRVLKILIRPNRACSKEFLKGFSSRSIAAISINFPYSLVTVIQNQIASSWGDLCGRSVRDPFKKYAFSVSTRDSILSQTWVMLLDARIVTFIIMPCARATHLNVSHICDELTLFYKSSKSYTRSVRCCICVSNVHTAIAMDGLFYSLLNLLVSWHACDKCPVISVTINLTRQYFRKDIAISRILFNGTRFSYTLVYLAIYDCS